MKVKIVRAEETVELGATGELRRLAVYRYTLDALGPFEVRIGLTEDQPEVIRGIIENKIKTIQGLEV